MEVIIKETYEEMSRAAARAVARMLNAKPNKNQDANRPGRAATSSAPGRSILTA